MIRCLVVLVSAASVAHARVHHMMESLESIRLQAQIRSRLTNLPKPQFFDQKQDHFDGSNPKTWKQAYYVNDTFWTGHNSSAPVFLCVGGEGPPLDGSAVQASVHCNVAVEWLEETGGLMFALEHRYYGCHNKSACPVPNLDADGALRFLSSRQALADIAQFHAFATQFYKLNATNRWVTWGGSYPGMLAAWARLKFPHLFFASVSSSAPVRAKLEMSEYNDVVSDAYTVQSVGGSIECRDAIANGHEMIGLMMGIESQRQILSALFGVPDNFADVNYQRSFAGYGVFPFPAQSNDPACTDPVCNIEKICAMMTNATIGDTVERLAALRFASTRSNNRRFQSASESELRGALLPTVSIGEDDFWGYQTCTEFGFYQSCNVGSKCMFTQGLVTLESEMSFCTSQFGIASQTVSDNVDFSNVYYGSDRPEGSRVLWVNGEVDPWHALSVLVAPSASQPILWVPGASHHFWTHPSAPTDSAEIVQARRSIREQVGAWLVAG